MTSAPRFESNFTTSNANSGLRKEESIGNRRLFGFDGIGNESREAKKKQKRFYSGEKKRHTIKTQIVTEKKSKKVICTSFSNGRKHDFRMFRESKVAVLPQTKILADAGYRGMQKIHKNVVLPHRKTKKNPLSKEQKKENRALMSQRAIVENVIRLLSKLE